MRPPAPARRTTTTAMIQPRRRRQNERTSGGRSPSRGISPPPPTGTSCVTSTGLSTSTAVPALTMRSVQPSHFTVSRTPAVSPLGIRVEDTREKAGQRTLACLAPITGTAQLALARPTSAPLMMSTQLVRHREVHAPLRTPGPPGAVQLRQPRLGCTAVLLHGVRSGPPGGRSSPRTCPPVGPRKSRHRGGRMSWPHGVRFQATRPTRRSVAVNTRCRPATRCNAVSTPSEARSGFGRGQKGLDPSIR